MQAPLLGDALGARTQRQVIGVAEQDLRPEGEHVPRGQGLHAALGPDRHEDRRLDRTVGGGEHGGPGRAILAQDVEDTGALGATHADPRMNMASP